jgi:hypothetical protein
MRATVAELVVRTLESLELKYPKPARAERARYAKIRQKLESERD